MDKRLAARLEEDTPILGFPEISTKWNLVQVTPHGPTDYRTMTQHITYL